MRRFSQRSHLVTLSEINITPLLDLAFVLLIIFVITTPLLEQSIDLKLPRGGRTENKLNKSDIPTVEISNTGIYALDRQRMQLPQLIARLTAESRANPNLVVYIRADKDSRYDLLAAAAGHLPDQWHHGYSFRTDPTPTNEPAPKKMRHRHGGISPAAADDFGFRLGLFHPRPKAGRHAVARRDSGQPD